MKRTKYAFIFARGGSKGLPGKNLLPINGIPLVGLAVQAAKQVSGVEKVFLSTDSQEIAESGERFGAFIIERPKELATDSASEWDAWKHAIEYVENNYEPFEVFLSVPPVAPCRRVIDIEACLDALQVGVDFVLTGTQSHRNPWFNMVKEEDDGFISLVNRNTSHYTRRQDTPRCLDIATVAYAGKTGFIKMARSFWDGRVKIVEIPIETAIDIDTEFDYFLAKCTMELSR